MSINAMLASPRDIWIDVMIAIICIMPCLYHVMISKSYFAVLHVDILQYDELLLLPSFKRKIWKWMSSLDIIFREIHHDGNHDGSIDKFKWF